MVFRIPYFPMKLKINRSNLLRLSYGLIFLKAVSAHLRRRVIFSLRYPPEAMTDF
jgi:hypothetical protein